MPRLPAAPAAAWLGLAALAALAFRQAIAFALSSGGAGDVESMFFDAADNPPWLIVLVSAALLYSRRRDLRRAVGAPGSFAAASALLAPGLALLAWARFVSAPDLALVGAVAMGIGLAWLCCGAAFARRAALPVALLGFAMPAPGALVNAIVWPLQLWTSDYAFALFRLLGGTAVQSADVIRTASHTFLVIEGCSGLGSMEVLTLLALAWAWQVGASFGRGLVLALAAPIIAFALNGPRVLGLVMFPDSPFWSGHTTQGVVVFAVGALAIAVLDRFLEPRAGGAPPATWAPAAPWPARPPRGALIWAAAAALASLAVPRFDAPPLPEARSLLPDVPPAWTSAEAKADELYLGSVRPDRSEGLALELARGSRERERWGGEPVSLLVAESSRRHRDNSLLSRKTELPGRGWRGRSRELRDLPGRYVGVRVTATRPESDALAYTLYLGLESPWEETLRALLALDQSPFRRPQRAYAIRVSTPLARGPAGTRLAERRLSEALRFLRPLTDQLAGRVRPGLRQ